MPLILTPNWKYGLKVEYEFNTSVFTSRDGTESRRALRSDPRSSVRFRTWRQGVDAGELQSVLDVAGVTEFSTPDPSREARLATDLAEGIDQVTLVTMPNWVVAGAAVVLIAGDTMGTLTVQSVTGLTVDFVETSGALFPAGTLMFGAFPSVANKSFRATWRTSNILEVDFDCRVLPGSDKLPDPVAWPTTFAGTPVFDLTPNWTRPPSIVVVANKEVTDFGRGVIDIRDVRGFVNQDTRWLFTEVTTATVINLVDFFRLQKGMRGTFYAPSRVSDLYPAGAMASASSTLRIKGRWPYDTYATRPYNQAVNIQLADGTIVRRKITAWTLFEGELETEITVDTPWGVDVSETDIGMISWLRKSRFAADRLTVDWKTNTVASVAVTVRSLRN